MSTVETSWPRPSPSWITANDSFADPSWISTVADSTAWPAIKTFVLFPPDRATIRAGLPASWSATVGIPGTFHAGRPITIGYHWSPVSTPVGHVSDVTRCVSRWVDPVAIQGGLSTVNATGWSAVPYSGSRGKPSTMTSRSS